MIKFSFQGFQKELCVVYWPVQHGNRKKKCVEKNISMTSSERSGCHIDDESTSNY